MYRGKFPESAGTSYTRVAARWLVATNLQKIYYTQRTCIVTEHVYLTITYSRSEDAHQGVLQRVKLLYAGTLAVKSGGCTFEGGVLAGHYVIWFPQLQTSLQNLIIFPTEECVLPPRTKTSLIGALYMEYFLCVYCSWSWSEATHRCCHRAFVCNVSQRCTWSDFCKG